MAHVYPDAEDAVSIAFEVPLELQDEYRGSAGQHVVVRLVVAGEDTRRTYSLVNAPGEWPLRIVPRVHSAGKMSRYLAESLRAGERVEVLAPNGSFTPRRAEAGGPSWRSLPAAALRRSVNRARSWHGSIPGSIFYGNTHGPRHVSWELWRSRTATSSACRCILS